MKRVTVCILFLSIVFLAMFVSGCAAKNETAADSSKESAAQAVDSVASEQAQSDTQAGEVAQETDAPVIAQDMPMFPWLDYTAGISLCTDDPDKLGVTQEQAQGRYVMLEVACVGGEFSWGDIAKNYDMFTLRDADDNEYEAHHSIFTSGGGGNIDDLDTAKFPSFGVVFDVPLEYELDMLSLLIDTDVESERVIIKMTDVL